MARKVLCELLWHPEKSLADASITYIHRGAPGDRITISGAEIERLDQAHFIIKRRVRETWIPYHRITEIKAGDEVLYRKIGAG
ncbi:MAG TPA: DUF504 domain-containing protein [Euryarchaeota archaeon]|nr:hypothetical protein BMS3Abin16_00265 [archaeon BMS3Abin16]HDH28559.1 DUF504 domain-containing protein [Euryarchaeota archaeon]